jgi:FixJ family two-component response regulator
MADDEAVRDSIAMLLRLHGIDWVGCASAEALLADLHVGPAVALVDVRLPAFSRLELQRWLGSSGTVLPVVVITAFGDVAMAMC